MADYRTRNAEKLKSYQSEWRKQNVEHLNAEKAAWAAANPGKVKLSKASYVKRNPAKLAAAAARRRVAQTQATPPWADLAAIEAIYARANALGMQVDHVIPLRGATVCGLHVEGNLQLLDSLANKRKNNRFRSDWQ